MIVMKFGGSSLANAERIRRVADIVRDQLARKPALVLSAMGDATDHLLEAAGMALKDGTVSVSLIEDLHRNAVRELGLENAIGKEGPLKDFDSLFEGLKNLLVGISLVRELSLRMKDCLVSFGERLSVRIMTAWLESAGVKAAALDAWDAGIVSDSNFSAAEAAPESRDRIPKALNPLINAGTVPVITGFIAKDKNGTITTLGRGGSDLSATIIAAACGAEEAQVWKDVDGILTADPRVVKNARPVEEVTYDEAAELAYFGAQVLHPRAMLPCMKTGIPVLVKNSFNPLAPGTRIVPSPGVKPGPVRAITSRKNVTLVDLASTRMLGQYGFLEGVFSAFARRRISVDMVATSEVSVSLTLDAAHDLEELRGELEKIASVEIKTGKAIVTIVGDVRRSSEILARSFRTCEILGVPVQMVSQGASKVNISFIVDDTEAADVVNALHSDFFDSLRRVHVPPGEGEDGEKA
ncbi:MAG: aspartate kinase [Treponema sp.]|jgi:aspartate kinase|nr:aspartate kinase [Treponema sp.]